MSSPARDLIADRNFRGFWVAQTCLAGINGTMRFTFVWLVVTLTDWSAAEGIVAGLLGLPAMLFSAAAGAWSDRVDRKRMFDVWTIASVLLLVGFTVMIAAGVATPFLTGLAAVLVGTTVMVNPPNLNAMVPLLVAPERLLNAIALQNGAMQAANFAAVILAGIAIEFLGEPVGSPFSPDWPSRPTPPCDRSGCRPRVPRARRRPSDSRCEPACGMPRPPSRSGPCSSSHSCWEVPSR